MPSNAKYARSCYAMLKLVIKCLQSTQNASMDLKAYGGGDDADVDVDDVDEKLFLELLQTSSGS